MKFFKFKRNEKFILNTDHIISVYLNVIHPTAAFLDVTLSTGKSIHIPYSDISDMKLDFEELSKITS